MKRFFKLLLITTITLLFAGILLFAAFIVEWERCRKSDAKPEITEIVFPQEKKTIARKIPFTVRIKAPWGTKPVSAEMQPGAGAQEGKNPEISHGKWFWGAYLWNFTFWIQPYRDGSIPASQIQISFEGGADGKTVIKTEIPSFESFSVPVSPGTELAIADEVPVEGKNPDRWFWFLIAGIILLVLILWFIFRKKVSTMSKAEPVWKTALDAISGLRDSLKHGITTPETAVIKLTDVVRNYLETRFMFRAEHQTTPEFLEFLRKDQSLLDLEQRRFLREFLSAADMVKFAKLPADESLFENAAGRAEMLIRNTSEENSGKEKQDENA